MTQDPKLGDLQHAIMRELWRRGEATVAEVHEALHAERGLAPTTISTMLKKMEAKGVVAHRTEGRRFVYRARIAEPEVIGAAVDQLAERHFDGRVGSLVSHLLSQGDIDAGELEDLKAMIERAANAETEGER